MTFSLDVIPARKGDCLILHYGTADEPRIMMIDGGPSAVYGPHLKPQIEHIRNSRNLDDDESLTVDIVMVSHVDDDHIKGILDLTNELRGQKEALRPLLLRARSLWHNSFDDLLDTTPEELGTAEHYGTAAVNDEIDIPESADYDVAKVLASISQGRGLRLDAEYLEWKLNHKFDGKLIMAHEQTEPVSLPGGMKVTVVGPLKNDLVKLQTAHDRWLREHPEITAESVLAAYTDSSVSNLSSIVLLVEADGKTMLLTGDARGDKILEGLQLVGLLDEGDDSSIHVDLLKIPHHGSANNLEVDFFKRITADHYVFSGNGEHGNPERETLEMLLEARPTGWYKMYFTYPIDEIDKERKKDWNKQRDKEKAKGHGDVRAAWSAKKHSLTALFEAEKKFAKKARTIENNEPYVIELSD